MNKPSNPAQLGFDPERLQRINAMMTRYVEEGRTAGMLTLVSRKGKIAHLSTNGYMDIAAQTPMREDTIFRIYSMTKAITSVALMTLLEQGKFQLDDAACRWIPALRTLKVYRGEGELEALERDITIRQLLTHTAGFTYGFEPNSNPVDKMYAETWRDFNSEKTLSELLESLFKLPLIDQPGTRWHYSIATDICGYLVELISGMPFGDYLQRTIFDPLAMVATAFAVPAARIDRFATLYGYTEHDPMAPLETNQTSPFVSAISGIPVRLQSGGAGLTSTASDYLRFARMMLNRGELEGRRILQADTVALMTSNHLDPKLLPLGFNGVAPGANSG